MRERSAASAHVCGAPSSNVLDALNLLIRRVVEVSFEIAEILELSWIPAQTGFTQ